MASGKANSSTQGQQASNPPAKTEAKASQAKQPAKPAEPKAEPAAPLVIDVKPEPSRGGRSVTASQKPIKLK